jgi:hypothetical protein
LNEYGKTILFDSGKFFQKQSFSVLESITSILKRMSNSKLFMIEGHTDSDVVMLNQTCPKQSSSKKLFS